MTEIHTVLEVTYQHKHCCDRVDLVHVERFRGGNGVVLGVVAPVCLEAPSNGNMQLMEVSRRVV